MPNFFDDNLVIHTHIEKTAGSTLVRGFTRAFGADRIYDLRSNKVPPPETLSMEERENIYFLTGHFHYGSHDKVSQRTKIYVACVRPALDRLRSYFYFVKSRQGHPGHGRISGRSFGQFVEELLRDDNSKINAMSRALTGISHPTQELVFDRLENSFLIVSPHDLVNETLGALVTRFGSHKDPKPVYANKGSSPEAEDIGSLADRFNQANSLDIALHDYVSERYPVWLNRLGDRLAALGAGNSMRSKALGGFDNGGAAPASLAQVARKPPHAVLGLSEWVEANDAVPVAWATPAAEPGFPNLRDAITPIIVSAVTGKQIMHRHLSDSRVRLVAGGNISPAHQGGQIHFWGAGSAGVALSRRPEAYAPLPNTSVHVHAVRGPYTAEALRKDDIEVPEIYGDPVLFLPKIVSAQPVAKTWELGVIVDAPELLTKTPDGVPDPSIERYFIPPELRSTVRIISMFADRSTRGILDKIDTIRSCKRIATVNVTGLMISAALEIPCSWFAKYSCGAVSVNLGEVANRVDSRVRDFYMGVGVERISYFGNGPARPTAWAKVIDAIDASWSPINLDLKPLFDALPLKKTVRYEDDKWAVDWATLDTIPG